jgi:hypothetical protein
MIVKLMSISRTFVYCFETYLSISIAFVVIQLYRVELNSLILTAELMLLLQFLLSQIFFILFFVQLQFDLVSRINRIQQKLKSLKCNSVFYLLDSLGRGKRCFPSKFIQVKGPLQQKLATFISD